MNIGQASKASGVSAKMIRYYEEIGLIPRAGRSANGYRVYSATEVHTLGFIRRARKLGFPVERIEALVRLWQDKSRASAEVKAIAEAHIAELEERVAELEAMRGTLAHLVDCCQGDARPDCPIIDGLAAPARH